VIVDPDFLDHWRTGMVVDALGDPTAPLCILRLWAHCQERKSDTFVMPTRGLKAQCKFQGDADAFERALTEAGFIRRDGENIVVCGWAEKNASLIAAWENGKGGGRPRKARNPEETQGKPTGYQSETQGKPNENPPAAQTKPIREEKRREEEIQEPSVLVGSLPDGIDADPPTRVVKLTERRIPCPAERLLEAFHAECPTLPRVIKLNDRRRQHLTSRWREVDADSKFASADDGVEIFRAIFRKVNDSDFLSGRAKDWHATFDWLTESSTNFLKVCEGHYDNERNDRKPYRQPDWMRTAI